MSTGDSVTYYNKYYGTVTIIGEVVSPHTHNIESTVHKTTNGQCMQIRWVPISFIVYTILYGIKYGTVLQRMYFIAKWSVQRLRGTGNMN